VTFVPPGVTVAVEPGTTILEAGRRAGVDILAPCAGRGTCGKCAVRVLEGDPGPTAGSGGATVPATMRLACLTRPTSDVTVRAVNATFTSPDGPCS
jgi:ferredoxin